MFVFLYASREALEKLRAAIKDGRNNPATKKNKALLGAEDTANQLNYDLNKAESDVRFFFFNLNIILYFITGMFYLTNAYMSAIFKGEPIFDESVRMI